MTDGQPRADHIDESLARKSHGAFTVAIAVGITAVTLRCLGGERSSSLARSGGACTWWLA
jgi:hypothetical protein